eukprot:gene10773-22499_t
MPLEPSILRLKKYYLYETASYFYLIGSDSRERTFRLIKFDRGIIKPSSLSEILIEDQLVYSKEEIAEMLAMINEGNKTSGGLVQVAIAYGIVGFTRFLDCYYITLITQKKKVGRIGNNTIYAIKAAEVFPIRPQDEFTRELSFRRIWHHVNKRLNQTATEIAESRYMGLFQFIDLTKDFFFSYTYDLTNSIQHNFKMSEAQSKSFPLPPCQEMYEWNGYQTEEFRSCLGDLNSCFWILPVIHGSFQQRRYSLFGRYIDLILIARRSRHYAGTRYLKRGISSHGKVANDCETEQIIQSYEGHQQHFTSYLQMRGSVPTYWQQETSVTMPVPPIVINRFDPSYLSTQEHFSDLLRRYSSPIVVLDLLKLQEQGKRESILGNELRYAISVLNNSMDRNDETRLQKIRYCALDFSRISKTKGQHTHTHGGNVLDTGSEALQGSDTISAAATMTTSATIDDSYSRTAGFITVPSRDSFRTDTIFLRGRNTSFADSSSSFAENVTDRAREISEKEKSNSSFGNGKLAGASGLRFIDTQHTTTGVYKGSPGSISGVGVGGNQSVNVSTTSTPTSASSATATPTFSNLSISLSNGIGSGNHSHMTPSSSSRVHMAHQEGSGGGSVDVLRELEEISDWALSDTSFFCR